MVMRTAVLPRSWRPQRRDDLVRCGSPNDGGYVLSQRIIQNTQFLIGLGVYTNWQFEEEFSRTAHCAVNCYDHSAGLQFLIRLSFKYLISLAFSPSIGKLRYIKLPFDYYFFFRGPNVHYCEKIGDGRS